MGEEGGVDETARTSKTSSKSGAGPAANFLGTLPKSVALWKGIGCSEALYLTECPLEPVEQGINVLERLTFA